MIGRSDMAKFSKKGWSSDPNYDNFSSGGLERHMDNLRADLAGVHEGGAKCRRFHETAGYVKGFGNVDSRGYVKPKCPESTKSFAEQLAAARISEIESRKTR